MSKYRIITTFDGKFVAQEWREIDIFCNYWNSISFPYTLKFARKVIKEREEKDSFVPEVVYQTPEPPTKPSFWQKIKSFWS